MKHFIDNNIIAEYCARFNAQDDEPYRGDISNSETADFLTAEIPRWDCPDPVFREIWYFRWWSFRKHIRTTPYGRVLLEFMPDVSWAGAFNTISCPAAHQIREARWFNDKAIAEEYLRFWLNPETGADPRKYTFGTASALLDTVSVTGNTDLLRELYPALCTNFAEWKKTHRRPNGFFRQSDGRDGMECSIGGSGYRVTINSCMAAEANSLAIISSQLGNSHAAEKYRSEGQELRSRIETLLWNEEYKFFMTRREEDERFVNVRELHGYTPWYYFRDMAEKYDCAWKQLIHPDGFLAPYGPTTAERRHPAFRIARDGHECQWNGPSWPFATSITLTALAHLLQTRESTEINRRAFFETLSCYTRSHYLREHGRIIPWIDENLDPFTGTWLARDIMASWAESGQKQTSLIHERGKDYSHSTYADLIIHGLCGINTEFRNKIRIQPLLPPECWDYFLLDGVKILGHNLSLQFDRDGSRYRRGAGLTLYIDGMEADHRHSLQESFEIAL